MTLYISGVTPEGKPIIAGLFRLKDEIGYPIDMSYEECQAQGYAPDWAEALADAGAQGTDKYDALVAELGFLLGDQTRDKIVDRFKTWGATLMQDGDNFKDVCGKMMEHKHAL